MQTRYTIQHSAYTGSTDDDGYPTGDEYASPVDRPAFGWYSLSSNLDPSMEYDRRVVTSKVVGVPDPSVYSVRDKVTLAGDDYFVSEDIRDLTHGPFSQPPGGEIVVEKVTG